MDVLDPGKDGCMILNWICFFFIRQKYFNDFLKSLVLLHNKKRYAVFCTNTVVKKLMTSNVNPREANIVIFRLL